MGTTQIGKSPAMPPPIWKNPIEPSPLRSFLAVFVYHSASHVMYSMPVRTVCTFLISPVTTRPAYMLPSVASSQPGTMMGRFFSQAASIHEFFGSIW
jgi:hypothetical protein